MQTAVFNENAQYGCRITLLQVGVPFVNTLWWGLINEVKLTKVIPALRVITLHSYRAIYFPLLFWYSGMYIMKTSHEMKEHTFIEQSE